MKGSPCVQVRLLDEILSHRSIPNEMNCGTVQIVHVRQGNGFEISNISFARYHWFSHRDDLGLS
jgi:hypothetical protein